MATSNEIKSNDKIVSCVRSPTLTLGQYSALLDGMLPCIGQFWVYP